ncbi:FAD-dependent oxidoreductase [Marinilactibacillus psychrotolerans]|uniref:CoA-disulfide reductase n=1 Tax=Marinilactibacillus psychrotolerans TaxID=191770 RepID=A0AAV3WR81_9LACT|nr:FAD-dependent oxidoreductase [Marinilactibacillus psychrotolerans]GEL67730.1 CoA-disulfide reductase [Marinilactibacillus psychrotolerans]GEQ35600.1 CoA-disulfide reductase [Marinilactibacillus psychrotolerans]SDC69959.1 NADPH-dependent 2,4-dienoyl-CoA reductase, sulfur reductase [Marinilactibacillus psychrotolerans]
MRILIIGGVAGGMSAATRLRRLNEDAEIIILEKGPYVSFANCGLPYYVAGEIEERSKLLVQTPESLQARFNLDVRPESEAIAINAQTKEVTVKNDKEEYTLEYDKLILSPGAKPLIPPIDGIKEAENIFTLRSVPDVDAISAYIDNHKPEKAVVIGAGFIGLEMAESLVQRGLEVTIVEKAPHVLPPLDEEMAAYIAKELHDKGVEIYTELAASAFEESGKVVVLENGVKLDSDLTLLSVGVKPNTDVALTAGIETGFRGGIVVDDHYETNQKDIYAVGDAIVVKQQINNQDTMIALASPANRQGRQVADIISGLNRFNKGSIGTAIVRVFEQVAASTGLNEKQLENSGEQYDVIHVQGKSHAGYYPNAGTVLLKLLFNPVSGKIYGAQAAGTDGIDKRIDILATAIKAGLTIQDLPELEFTYAPPFGSAKDPVNMAGYAALNIIEGVSESIQWHELEEKQSDGHILLDVRNESELIANGQLPNALNIPLDSLRERISEIPKDQPVIVSCHSGLRSYIAERLLKQNGYKVKNLDGAFALYSTIRPERIIK